MIYRAARPITMTLLATLALLGTALAGNWPQWRGPNGDGVSEETGLPLKWDEKTNILWKCPLADGASTPAVWGDAVFVTAQDGDALLLVKIDKKKGAIAWSRKVDTAEMPSKAQPRGKSGDERRHQKFHQLHNMASPSPVTDGDVVIAHFGNGALAAYDFDGKQLWNRNLQKEHGDYTIWWGHANSPVLFKDLVISVCMQDSLADLGGDKAPSYVIAHDKRTGEKKWKTDRMTPAQSEHCDSYTTPIFHKTKDRMEMIVMGGEQIDAEREIPGPDDRGVTRGGLDLLFVVGRKARRAQHMDDAGLGGIAGMDDAGGRRREIDQRVGLGNERQRIGREGDAQRRKPRQRAGILAELGRARPLARPREHAARRLRNLAHQGAAHPAGGPRNHDLQLRHDP